MKPHGPHAPGNVRDLLLRSSVHGAVLVSSVVTNQALIRGVVTAFSWLGANIKAFSSTRLEAAIAHIDAELTPEEVSAAVEALKAQVNG